jgi:hypothetical protein
VASKKKCKVFVSYSRHDEALVRPLAGLLGVAADDAVFLDVTSLRPGQLWEKEIFDALKDASVFVLCWCCESQKSHNVAKEIAAALSDERKKLVPVLFCEAPLPTDLKARQWTDLRGKIVHKCPVPHDAHAATLDSGIQWQAASPSAAPQQERRKRRGLKYAGVAAGLFAALVVCSIVFSSYSDMQISSPVRHESNPHIQVPTDPQNGHKHESPQKGQPDLPSFGAAKHEDSSGPILGIILVAIVVTIALIATRKGARTYSGKPLGPVEKHADEIAATAKSYFESLAYK